MRETSNECVDCGLPCLGPACPYTHVVRYYCDRCGEEIGPDDMYRVDDEDLCEWCLKKIFKADPEYDITE